MTGSRKRPVAVCTDCISYSFDKIDILQPCRVRRGERHCGGTYMDATDPIHWKECTACSGSGEAFDGNSCVACQATGWLLTRRR